MTIREFIFHNAFLPRLKRTGILAVYDPYKRYRELCLGIQNDVFAVVDASESSITSREAALLALREFGRSDTKQQGLLIYIPTPPPLTEEDKQNDPFSLYSACGSLFPDGDGDEYINLCLKAKPDFATEIRRVFTDNPNPSFEVIDAIGGGNNWPILRTTLKVESARDIILALLVPNQYQTQAIVINKSWIPEAKQVFLICLGMKLITQMNDWQAISEELWRYILFSEFYFDLPDGLPESLSNVPKAHETARPLIEDICDQLRNDYRTQSIYIDKATSVEKMFDLAAQCKDVSNFGIRDTFAFEERYFLKAAISAFQHDDIDNVKLICDHHTNTVWSYIGESQAKWAVIQATINLYVTCGDLERQLPQYVQTQEKLVDFYVGSLREADRLQREFEYAVSVLSEIESEMKQAITLARNLYSRLVTNMQKAFIRNLEKTGWPLAGKISNSDVFDTIIAPKLVVSGNKVAYFLIDSLRYELGVALEGQLSEDGQIEVKPALAQLPSVTSVGMASLLPGAGSHLSLKIQDENLVPIYDNIGLVNVNNRLDIFKHLYGQRFQEMSLSDLVKGKVDLASTVELCVIRSNEIDLLMENDVESALKLIHDTLKRIRIAILKLKKLNFKEVIIASDHGFFLNTNSEAGDICNKPVGQYINIHERFVLGQLIEDNANYCIASDKLGIRGNILMAGGPRNLIPYRAGELYLHGGASLQECIVPVIIMKLNDDKSDYQVLNLNLSYKNGASKITTMLPVFDLTWDDQQIDLFSSDIELLLEAQDKKGNVVGEAKIGNIVNPATGTIMLKKGERVQVTIRMSQDYEGKFTVKVLNPKSLALYCKLDLETDYLR